MGVDKGPLVTVAAPLASEEDVQRIYNWIDEIPLSEVHKYEEGEHLDVLDIYDCKFDKKKTWKWQLPESGGEKSCRSFERRMENSRAAEHLGTQIDKPSASRRSRGGRRLRRRVNVIWAKPHERPESRFEFEFFCRICRMGLNCVAMRRDAGFPKIFLFGNSFRVVACLLVGGLLESLQLTTCPPGSFDSIRCDRSDRPIG